MHGGVPEVLNLDNVFGSQDWGHSVVNVAEDCLHLGGPVNWGRTDGLGAGNINLAISFFHAWASWEWTD